MFFPKFSAVSDFSITSFYKSLQDYLYVDRKLISKRGEVINKGEEFTVQFFVWNLMRRGVNFPNLWFKDVRLVITGTRWAEPVKGFTEKININRDIGPLQNELFEVKFVARETIGENFVEQGLDFLEEIAFVRCSAEVDFKKFFRFEREGTFRESIRPAVFPEDLYRFTVPEEELVPHKN